MFARTSELERRAIASPIVRIPTESRLSKADGIHRSLSSANLRYKVQSGFADGSCFYGEIGHVIPPSCWNQYSVASQSHNH